MARACGHAAALARLADLRWAEPWTDCLRCGAAVVNPYLMSRPVIPAGHRAPTWRLGGSVRKGRQPTPQEASDSRARRLRAAAARGKGRARA